MNDVSWPVVRSIQRPRQIHNFSDNAHLIICRAAYIAEGRGSSIVESRDLIAAVAEFWAAKALLNPED